MAENFNTFIQLVKHPVRFRMFLFLRLPAAFFSGVRVREISPASCTTVVPFKWFSQNPFRSTYFACLAMAAELSTGALALGHLYKRQPRVSMLVTAMEASFHRKAIGITSFTCSEGEKIFAAIADAIATGEGVTVNVSSTGVNSAGEPVATFHFQWSFKVKR